VIWQHLHSGASIERCRQTCRACWRSIPASSAVHRPRDGPDSAEASGRVADPANGADCTPPFAPPSPAASRTVRAAATSAPTPSPAARQEGDSLLDRAIPAWMKSRSRCGHRQIPCCLEAKRIPSTEWTACAVAPALSEEAGRMRSWRVWRQSPRRSARSNAGPKDAANACAYLSAPKSLRRSVVEFGNPMVKTQPTSGRFLTVKVPPMDSTFCRAIARPRPSPVRSELT